MYKLELLLLFNGYWNLFAYFSAFFSGARPSLCRIYTAMVSMVISRRDVVQATSVIDSIVFGRFLWLLWKTVFPLPPLLFCYLFCALISSWLFSGTYPLNRKKQQHLIVCIRLVPCCLGLYKYFGGHVCRYQNKTNRTIAKSVTRTTTTRTTTCSVENNC